MKGKRIKIFGIKIDDRKYFAFLTYGQVRRLEKYFEENMDHCYLVVPFFKDRKKIKDFLHVKPIFYRK